MTDPKATPRIADSTCCCCNEDCHAKRIAAEAKIENVGRQLVIETDKRMQAEIRLAAYENAVMPERPNLENLTCTATRDAEFGTRLKAALVITDYADALRAFAAKQAVDAGRYRWLRNKSANQYQHPIVVSQQIVSQKKHDFAMQYRGPLVFGELDAAIDAAKGK